MTDTKVSRKLFDKNTCHLPHCLFEHFNKNKIPLHSIAECKSKSLPCRYMCTECGEYGHHEKLCTVLSDAEEETYDSYVSDIDSGKVMCPACLQYHFHTKLCSTPEAELPAPETDPAVIAEREKQEFEDAFRVPDKKI